MTAFRGTILALFACIFFILPGPARAYDEKKGDKEKQKGNANRATLAVARKILTYLLAVDREQRDLCLCRSLTALRHKNRDEGKIKITRRARCQVPPTAD